MTLIEVKVKKWGNSLGIIIPNAVVEEERLVENAKIQLLLVKNSRTVFRETFGILKGRIKKSTQQIKDELRKELYDD